MHNIDRLTDHQEQQAHEANTADSQTIPLRSVGWTHSDRSSGRHFKTD